LKETSSDFDCVRNPGKTRTFWLKKLETWKAETNGASKHLPKPVFQAFRCSGVQRMQKSGCDPIESVVDANLQMGVQEDLKLQRLTEEQGRQ
jgi:hypothetical protein